MDEENSSGRMNLGSLLDLKSELQKKQNEAAKLKLAAKESTSSALHIKEKVPPVRELEKSSKQQRQQVRQIEDDNALAASRQKLEAKAKLYEKIKEGELTGAATELFLVDFQKKAIEETNNTKLTLKGFGGLPSADQVSETESEYMEKQRKKWAEEEIMASLKDHVTYQDVFFDEARAHGVGYYAFSREESERAAQKASLDAMRSETLEKQKEAAENKKKKQKELKERLKKVREKKRLQMGLPLEEEEDESEDEAGTDETLGVEEVRKTPEPESTKPSEDKDAPKPIRPWDIGKAGVSPEGRPMSRKVLSQEEWVEERRKDRSSEFAPPQVYQMRPSQVRKPPTRGAHAAHMFFARQQFKPAAKTDNAMTEISVVERESVEKSGKNLSSGIMSVDLRASGCLNDEIKYTSERMTAADAFKERMESKDDENEKAPQKQTGAAVMKRMTTADLFRTELETDDGAEQIPSTRRANDRFSSETAASFECTRKIEYSTQFSQDKMVETPRKSFEVQEEKSYVSNQSGISQKTDNLRANFGSRYLDQKQRSEKPGKTLKLYSSDITTNNEEDMRPGDRKKSAIPPPTCMDYYTSATGKTSRPSVVKRPKLADSISVGMSVVDKKKDKDTKKKDKGMLALF